MPGLFCLHANDPHPVAQDALFKRVGADMGQIRKIAHQAFGKDPVHVEWLEVDQKNCVVGSQGFLAGLDEIFCICVESPRDSGRQFAASG